MKHDLYKTGDADAPESIKDSNGEVVLALCRKCGKGEADLGPDCLTTEDTWECDTCHKEGGVYRGSDGWYKAAECEECRRPGNLEKAERLNEMIRDRHRGYQFNRCESHPVEKIFQEAWLEDNRAHPGLNYGCSRLRLMLATSLEDAPEPSLRDFKVAATVIQWLGTHVGGAFLDELIRKRGQWRKEYDIAQSLKCPRCGEDSISPPKNVHGQQVSKHDRFCQKCSLLFSSKAPLQ